MKVFSKENKNKILAVSLIAIIALTGTGVVFPFTASAQSIGPVVPTSDFQAQRKLDTVIDGIGYEGGILGGLPIVNIDSVRGLLNQVCKEVIDQVGTTGGLDKFINGAQQTPSFWQQIIGGGAAEATSASVQAKVVQKGLDCVNEYLNTLEDVEIRTLIHGQEIQREQEKFSEIATSMVMQLYSLNARASASWKDVTKALMVRTLLNVNKNVTSNLANSMIQKYKIDDYLAYGDALATQVYAMKYIDQNFDGDARTQMMMRSLIQSEKVPEQARVAAAFANQQANEYIVSQCGSSSQLDAANGNSLACLASYGNEQSSPMFKYLNALDTSEKIKTEAKKTAQAEISQSDGFAPPRDCSGSVSLQSQADAQIITTTKERDAAQAVLGQLTDAFVNGQTSAEELAKAQAAYEAAEQKMANLPQTVSEPVVDICKAIDSPAKYLSNQISDWVGSLTDSATDLKPDNLPFYATFMSDVASNFLTNLLTGGKSTSQVFKEAGLGALNQAISSTANQTPGGSGTTGGTPSPVGNVGITAVSSAGQPVTAFTAGQSYTITINFSSIKNQNPTEVEISGPESGSVRRVVFAEEFNSGIISINYTATDEPLNLSVSFYKRYDQVSTLLINTYSKYFPVGTVSGVVTTNFSPRGEMRAPIQIR